MKRIIKYIDKDGNEFTPRTTEIICTDQDFYNAIELIKVIKGNNLAVYYKLQHPNSTSPDMEKEKYELKKKVFELHQNGESLRKISSLTGMPTTTIHNWIQKK